MEIIGNLKRLLYNYRAVRIFRVNSLQSQLDMLSRITLCLDPQTFFLGCLGEMGRVSIPQLSRKPRKIALSNAASDTVASGAQNCDIQRASRVAIAICIEVSETSHAAGISRDKSPIGRKLSEIFPRKHGQFKTKMFWTHSTSS